MPNLETPSSKRIIEIKDRLTKKMWLTFDVLELPRNREKKVTTFLINELANVIAEIEILKK